MHKIHKIQTLRDERPVCEMAFSTTPISIFSSGTYSDGSAEDCRPQEKSYSASNHFWSKSVPSQVGHLWPTSPLKGQEENFIRIIIR